MRKHMLQSVLAMEPQERPAAAKSGASRSMISSIEELAENAKRMAEGETIVTLDPRLVDASFVSDRIAQDDEDYLRLRDAIAANGQSSPILVRPNGAGRFMIVYGHRRTRAAAELGIPVRAVVKELEEIAHIVAQGQENSARADLSFIEKAMFAAKLQRMGQSKEVAKAALSIDDTLLSRMLSVAEIVPAPVIEAIGAAKGIGRDRWEDLKKIVAFPAKARLAVELAGSAEMAKADDRFAYLVARLRSSGKVPRRQTQEPKSWSPPDRAVEATFRRSGKSFNLSLTARNAAAFGDYLTSALPGLYEDFQRQRETG